MKTIKILFYAVIPMFILVIYTNLIAFEDGIVGFTKKNGNTVGCVCHGFDPYPEVSVRISGPNQLHPNDTAVYTLSIANGPAVAGGCDISTSLGNVYPSPLDTILRRDEPFPGAGFELTHKDPKHFAGDTLKFLFRYVAPSSPNVFDTIFANGNSVNRDTTPDNDKWNYADNFVVHILPATGINENVSAIEDFRLYQNFPNPFNPETRISFELRSYGEISLGIFDMSGKEVASLISRRYYPEGKYSLSFNASQYGLTSGVYFYRLSAPGGISLVKKMVLLK